MKKTIAAKAEIRGSEKYPKIKGCAAFVPTKMGTMVSVSVYGLPEPEKSCEYGIFGMHIHQGKSCTGTAKDPFADVSGHYNPKNCEHPFHSGDMPPLYAYGDKVHMAYITDRFTPEEVIGRTIIIHRDPDDLHTQPSGNSGEKIACGEIVPLEKK